MDWLTAEEAKAIQYEKTHGIAYSHISKEIHDRWVKQGLVLIMFDITQNKIMNHNPKENGLKIKRKTNRIRKYFQKNPYNLRQFFKRKYGKKLSSILTNIYNKNSLRRSNGQKKYR